MRRGDEIPAPVTQRRRLAILAILAAAGERGASRDSVIALLWPESDIESGRHSLRQTLYGLRRDLREVIIQGTSDLRLDPRVVGSDVADLERRMARRDAAGAILLYAGPFLQGFHLNDSGEFGRWVDGTRDRIAHRFAAAVEEAATSAAALGKHEEAFGLWRCLLSLDPLSSRVALKLVQALVSAHDEVGALRAIDAYARLAQEEMGVGLPPALETIRASLRARSSVVLKPALTLAPVEERAVTPAGTAKESVSESSGLSHVASVAPPRWSKTKGWPKFMAVVAFAIVGGLWLGAARRQATDAPILTPGRVAVFPFVIDAPGQPSSAAALESLLGATVNGIGGLTIIEQDASWLGADSASTRTISPVAARTIARRRNAALFVLGRLNSYGHLVRLSVALYQTRIDSAPLSHAEVEGPLDSALTFSARAAIILFANQIAGINAPLQERAAVGSQSPEALRYYLEGEDAFRRFRFADAADAFGRAVRADSMFALAYYRLSTADDWASRGTDAAIAAERAYRLRDRLTPHDSLRLVGLVAWRRGDYDQAELLYRNVVNAYPWDLEAWYQLGEVLFHGNPPRGRSVRESEAAFEHVLAAQPTNREVLVHLQLLAALSRSRNRIDSVTRRIRASVSDSEALPQMALAAFALRDTVLETRVLQALRSRDEMTIYNVAWRVGTFSDNIDGSLRIAQLLTEPNRGAAGRAVGFGLQSFLHLAQGQLVAASADLDAGAPLLPNWILHLRAWETFFPAHPAEKGVRRAMLDSLEHHVPALEAKPGTSIPAYSWPEQRAQNNLFLRALLTLSLADHAGVERVRRLASRQVALLPSRPTLAGEIGAMEAAATKRYERALADLGDTPVTPVHGFGASMTLRYLMGRWALGAGRMDEALGHFGTFEQIDLESLAFAADAHRLRGAVFEQKGDSVAAIEEYRRVLELWQNCDSAMVPARDSVKRRVRDLSGGRAQRR